ncbi:hypothetical protein [Spirosoma arcticum]
MNAVISFRKEANKPPVFTFKRSDGSITWSKLRNLLVEHDLAHYAVETTLHFKEAFYGLLDQGFTTEDFERPRDKRPQTLLPVNLPLQAHQAEHIVGLLQIEWLSGPNSNFIEDLKQALEQKGFTYPNELTIQQLDTIRNAYLEVIYQWNMLPAGQQLDLPYAMK